MTIKFYTDIKQDDKLAPKEKAAMISNKVSEMKTRNYSMGRQVEDVKKKLSVVENQNSNYVTELREKNTYIDKNPAQICELKENFKKSERKSTALEEKVKRLEIEKAASEENFTALSAENSRALEEKIEKLEREKAASDDALAKLTAALHVK
jgi:chromosome segregation ATPase